MIFHDKKRKNKQRTWIISKNKTHLNSAHSEFSFFLPLRSIRLEKNIDFVSIELGKDNEMVLMWMKIYHFSSTFSFPCTLGLVQ